MRDIDATNTRLQQRVQSILTDAIDGEHEQPMKQFFPTYIRLAGWLRHGPQRRRESGSMPPPTPLAYRWTSRDRRAILRLMTVAADNRLPLAPLLDAFAWDANSGDGNRIHGLATLIEQGTSLADALEQKPCLASDNTLLAVRTGAHTGTLGAALRAALNNSESDGDGRIRTDLLGNLAYVAVVIAVMTMLISFMAVKIWPTFVSIMSDLNLEQPPVFRQGIAAVHAIMQWWWLGALLLCAVAFLILTGRFNRSLRYGWLGQFTQPWFGNQTADVLQNLSVVCELGRPLASAVSTMARYHYRPSIRQRLLFVRNELEHDAGLWDSMYRARLISADELSFIGSGDSRWQRPVGAASTCYATPQHDLVAQKRLGAIGFSHLHPDARRSGAMDWASGLSAADRNDHAHGVSEIITVNSEWAR